MEDDYAPPNPPPPPPLPRGRICFCCGRTLSRAQLARHRQIFLEEAEARFAAVAGAALKLQPEEDPGIVDDGMRMDNVEMEDEAGVAPDGAEEFEDPFAALEIGAGGYAGGNAGDNAADDVGDEAPPPVPGQVELVGDNLRNPPVLIDDWPDPDSEGEEELENFEDFGEDEPGDDGDEDPQYVERQIDPNQIGLDPLDEPDMLDAQLRELMREDLGDLADEEIDELCKDKTMLRFLATRLRTHFSRQTYNELRYGPCEPLGLSSEFIACRRLKILSGVSLRSYNCCVGSCVCFLGKYADHLSCPYCHEPRYTAGRPRRLFRYTPLIPQLKALFRSRDMCDKIGYRLMAEAEYDPGVYHDVFDGQLFRTLRQTRVDPDHEYKFFDNPEDLALGLSTDGFTLFKRRQRGHSTAWPIIFLNYNLHPRYRTKLENIICVGVIPGPRQCKDMNSFLVPVLEELLELERGVVAFKVPPAGAPDNILVRFELHAFLIMLFGDIPAISKLLAIKGHNGKTPCRACYIQGILPATLGGTTRYVPLTAPGARMGLPPHLLLRRTHDLFLHHYNTLDALDRFPAQRHRAAQEFGINYRPIFASLKSIDLATCAPYDTMHLLFENLIPNMILHWIGKFKGIDQGRGRYRINTPVWDRVGELTAAAVKMIPASFVGTLPDIAQHRKLFKAEGYAFWAQFIGPILLKDRLPRIYFNHFILMRKIIIRCVQYNITAAEVNELEEMVNRWVAEYERLYYQYEDHRLPTCPLTIHALLHMPMYIRQTGPLCNSWAFVMERFCGRLLPAVKNRYQPYEHLDNYISRRAQMQAACHKFDLPTLPRSTVKWTLHGRERLSSRERMYPDFDFYIFGAPMVRNPPVDVSLTNQLVTYFGTTYMRHPWSRERQEIIRRIDCFTLIRHGSVRMTDDGDRIRTASAVERSTLHRDNSFIRYDLNPDANARFRRRRDRPVRRTYYGRLLDLYYLQFIEDIENNTRRSYILARVMECRTGGRDAALPENPQVTYSQMGPPTMIHINTIDAVIGRIKLNRDTWAIIDTSRHGARTQFVNEDNDDD